MSPANLRAPRGSTTPLAPTSESIQSISGLVLVPPAHQRFPGDTTSEFAGMSWFHQSSCSPQRVPQPHLWAVRGSPFVRPGWLHHSTWGPHGVPQTSSQAQQHPQRHLLAPAVSTSSIACPPHIAPAHSQATGKFPWPSGFHQPHHVQAECAPPVHLRAPMGMTSQLMVLLCFQPICGPKLLRPAHLQVLLHLQD